MGFRRIFFPAQVIGANRLHVCIVRVHATGRKTQAGVWIFQNPQESESSKPSRCELSGRIHAMAIQGIS